jgi:hypothetical protein
MNSRNRPGPLSIPGEMGSLNFIPEAPLQPSDLGGDEYQTNDAMAWVIRMSLAMNAKVVPNARVTNIKAATDKEWRLDLFDGRRIRTPRIILATGLGAERPVAPLLQSDRILGFSEFMKRMDSPFPLRDMKRVAVIGGGDGAKTIIESLTGKGPSRGYSVAALDWPDKIDWYGAEATNKADWLKCNRARYSPIASLLRDPNKPQRPYRVEAQGGSLTSEQFGVGYNCVYVGQTPYDYIVHSTGYVNELPGLSGGPETYEQQRINARRFGRARLDYKAPANIFIIGPASDLKVVPTEVEILQGVAENNTSIFRYAPRTALLAASLA